MHWLGDISFHYHTPRNGKSINLVIIYFPGDNQFRLNVARQTRKVDLACEDGVGYGSGMRRLFAIFAFGIAGCSTTPVADLMDAVAPGGPGTRHETAPRHRAPVQDYPIQNRDRSDDPPPLPPVPVGYLEDGNEGSARPPAARLLPKPVRPNE